MFFAGPVETDSADDLVLNGNNNSNNNCTYSNNNNSNSGSSNRCSSPALSELSAATSEAPNFEIPFDSNPSSPRAPLPHVFSHSNTSADAIHAADTKRLSVAEPGRGRMTLKTSQSVTRCKLFGRDFPVSEHVLLQSDIESVSATVLISFLVLTLCVCSCKLLSRHAGTCSAIGISCTARVATDFP